MSSSEATCKLVRQSIEFNNTAYHGNFGCFLINACYVFESAYLPEVSMALEILVLLISIFGNIKEHYRWHVLNKTVFALLYLISRLTPLYKYLEDVPQTTISSDDNIHLVYDFAFFLALLFDGVIYAQYFVLLHFSISRFIATFYPLRYDRVYNRKTIPIIFVVVNVLSVALSMLICFMYLYSAENLASTHRYT